MSPSPAAIPALCAEHVSLLASLAQNVRDLNEKVDRMDTKLFGNGQPGHIQRLDTRISGMRDAFSIKQWLPLLLQIITTVAGLLGVMWAISHGK